MNNDVYIAGGVYSEYNSQSPFSHLYPQAYDYFKKNQDIDIYFVNQPSNRQELLAGGSRTINTMNSIKNSGLNYISTYNNNNPVFDFDYDCCQIWLNRKFDTQTYIPISILNQSINKMEPTFINPIITLNMCICLPQIRALKYMMKSCFIVENLLEEANECKRLFTYNKFCNICKNKFSFCE